MEHSLRLGLMQMNSTIGALERNKNKIIENINKAAELGCRLVAFPELCITGYPPEDLLYRKDFISDQRTMLKDIASHCERIVAIVGFVDDDGECLYNAAAILAEGKHLATYRKINLPNYSVFDEERYFTAGSEPLILHLGHIRVGISICEDIWVEHNVTEVEGIYGHADILLNISASPYYKNKGEERRTLLQKRSRFTGCLVAYANLVGGQDELVFDGQSMLVKPDGSLQAAGKAFEEDFIAVDVDIAEIRSFLPESETHKNASINPFGAIHHIKTALPSPHKHEALEPTVLPPQNDLEEQIYKALLLALRDYVRKNGFEKVVLGLSGGIDSALVAALAADALGKENVKAISMPSQYTSQSSIDDARQLAGNLGIEYIDIEINEIYDISRQVLAPYFKGRKEDTTEENLQARIRGNLLMAFSNKFNWLVLATGNKSEVSVGYCTIYGDMVGGFSPLKDVYKMMVYRLCEYRNNMAKTDIIPTSIIEKAPSAELKPNQTDQDSLPPYPILDKILELYIERMLGLEEIVEQGFDRAVVKKVTRLVDINEYKRRQAAPGIKITPLSFGKDRRLPITNRYRPG